MNYLDITEFVRMGFCVLDRFGITIYHYQPAFAIEPVSDSGTVAATAIGRIYNNAVSGEIECLHNLF
jgi:hypothetical protein